MSDDDRITRKLRARRRQRAAAAQSPDVRHMAPETEAPSAPARIKAKRKGAIKMSLREQRELARGWWRCCSVYYAGFGWRNRKPACPACASEKTPRKATRGEVESVEREEAGW